MMATSILILIAMQEEAQPLIDLLSLREQGQLVAGYPMIYFEGESNGIKLHLVVNGKDPVYGVDRVATQPAAVTAFAAIEKFKPSVIVNAGTVGALSERGAAVNDVYLADTIYFLDRRIPLADYADYGLGHYQTNASQELAEQFDLKFAKLCTGNALGLTNEDWTIFRETGCVINDMEAASIADLAVITKTPFYAIKVVTNLLDTPEISDTEDFVNNFQMAVEKLANKSHHFITTYLCKTLDES